MRRLQGLGGVVAVAMLAACGTGVADQVAVEGDTLQAESDEAGTISAELSAGVTVGATLRTTGNLNLRTGAGLGYSIRLVMPTGSHVTVIHSGQPSGGWYNIKYNGLEGWSYGGYLALVSQGGGGQSTPPGASNADRDGAISRAKSGVGFSYWWGHGRWIPGGLSSGNAGYCSGSCPSCSHSGSYGADCSGYVGKIWQVPSTNDDPRDDGHPYSTINFNASNSQWSTVARANARRGDAFVYNSNGAGHIFLFESGDGWGSMWAYEAKGCAIGIVHDLRTAASSYHAIQRRGY